MNRQDFIAGAKTVAPVLLGAAPFGMIAGVAALDAGLSAWHGVGLSLIVHAGASQLAGLGLLGAGASPLVIVLTTAMINSRMMMYSAAIAPHFAALSNRRKVLLAYLLTDQAFAFSVHRFRQPGTVDKMSYYLGIALVMWINWITMTALGAFLGANVPPSWSLEFAIPLTFMAMLMPAIIDRPTLVAAVVGGAVATLCHDLPYNLGLMIAALSGVAGGVLARKRAAVTP